MPAIPPESTVANEEDQNAGASAGGFTFDSAWTEVSADGVAAFPASNNMRTATDGTYLYVYCGLDINSDGDNSIWRSADGITWTERNDGTGFVTSSSFWGFHAIGTNLYLFGAKGFSSGTQGGSTYKSTDGGANWTQLETHNTATSWGFRTHFGSCVFDSKLWIFGGQNEFSTFKDDVWKSSDGVTWTQAGSTAEWAAVGTATGRVDMTACGFGGVLYVIGGETNESLIYEDVWKSADNGATWTLVTAAAGFGERNGLICCVIDTTIFIYGAEHWDIPPTSAGFDDLWTSDDGGITWTQRFADLACTGLRRAAWGEMAAFDNSLWVIGNEGEDEIKHNDVWRVGYAAMPESENIYERPGCGVAFIDSEALASEFQVGVLIDLKRGLVSLGNECRFTCSARRISDCNAVAGDVNNTIIVADVNGYIGQFLDELAMGWGAPGEVFQWNNEYTPGLNDTFEVDLDSPTTLPIGADGSGMLEGLVLAKIAALDGAIELRRITSHSDSTFLVSADWTTNPAAGDIVIAGPIISLVQWSEARSRWPILVQYLEANIETIKKIALADGVLDFDPWLRVDQFSAATGEFIADLTGAAESDVFRLSELKVGLGRMRPTPEGSRGLSYQLLWTQSSRGPLVITAVRAVERTFGAEDGR